MVVTFEKEYLQQLYEEGKASDKKHRFQPDIVRRYKRGVDYLKAVDKPEDLYRLPSLHFEALKGDKNGLYSIRVNNQYRIEFSISATVLTVCNVIELSNHYK